VPGRIRDSGDGDVPGSSAATSAATTGARARLLGKALSMTITGPGVLPGPVFFAAVYKFARPETRP
jgi:hypothetical protein